MSKKKRKMAVAICAWCDLHLYADEAFKDEVYRLIRIHAQDCPSNPLVQQVKNLESENERLLDFVRHTEAMECREYSYCGAVRDQDGDGGPLCAVCRARALLAKLEDK